MDSVKTPTLLRVAKEAEIEFWGFLFVMLAVVMYGFRWTMSQILLQLGAVVQRSTGLAVGYMKNAEISISAFSIWNLDKPRHVGCSVGSGAQDIACPSTTGSHQPVC